ncbi:prolipoprotein diacylglyceryl transferase family protein [Phenylobacterium sp.]|uniref:prolipoprotein diacylglyceryl transferase family protein n=1 Tax=Phenylobacterium sp. TaxID=1871053 RepID=UPI002C42B287|nr:prolipoprotein diacylglyceryl transferase family protein [Phenylobacterium sp.]HLZ73707.1 prolipoprotein diacylglyceryl transferase family protein [Phenylobacterium sp.]
MIQVPTAAWTHTAFDLAAWASGGALSFVLYRWRLKDVAREVARRVDGGYFAALALGAIPGAWLAGSLNTLRDSHPALSHSVVGALVGAIVGVEAYKRLRGIAGSTGGVFVGSFSLGVVVGRFGCLFAGLPDGTYGTRTRLPWAVDLGDGVGRHPVELYESGAMALFLAAYLWGLKVRAPWAMRRGFYAMCLWYGVQRFAWEFLKPYPPLIGPFNLFHVLCGGLVAYGWLYWLGDLRRERAAQGRALSVPRSDHEPLRNLP